MIAVSETYIVSADVLRWNAEQADVKCPFCGHEETQSLVGIADIYGQSGFDALCSDRFENECKYKLSYPFNAQTQEVGYLFDRKDGMLVRIGAPARPSRAPETDVLDLERKLDGVTLSGPGASDDNHGGEALPTHPTLLINAILDFKAGDADAIATILVEVHPMRRRTRDSQELLSLPDDFSCPITAVLLLAARYANTEPLHALLDPGADPNSKTSTGRTALMEAALWGRLANFQLLLSKGAELDAADDDGRKAADYASASYDNDEERCERSRGPYFVELEDRYAFRQRRAILKLVEDLREPVFRADVRSAPFEHYKFDMTESAAKLCWSESGFISEGSHIFGGFSKPKAVGMLWVGPQFPVVRALSGNESGDEQHYLRSNVGTKRAIALAESLQIDLEGNASSRGSHVEMKLIAWFLEHHRPSDEGNPAVKAMKSSIAIQAKAWLLISEDQPCRKCGELLDKVAVKRGLEIEVHGLSGVKTYRKRAAITPKPPRRVQRPIQLRFVDEDAQGAVEAASKED